MPSLLCVEFAMCRVRYVPSLLCAELSHNHYPKTPDGHVSHKQGDQAKYNAR